MQKYGVNELRKMFLEFFESKGHLAMPSFSLVLAAFSVENEKSAVSTAFANNWYGAPRNIQSPAAVLQANRCVAYLGILLIQSSFIGYFISLSWFALWLWAIRTGTLC